MISRAEAKKAGLLRYFTGKPCVRRHVAERITRNGSCVRCAAEISSAFAKRNRALVNSRRRGKTYGVAARTRQLRWNAKNPDKLTSYGAARKAAALERTPAWADHDKIARVYTLAKFAEELTLQQHHVDHILPLQGRSVSGLHVHTNLRVLPGAENVRKSNRFTPYAEHYVPEHAVALINA